MRFSEAKWFLYSKSSENVFLKEDDKFRDLKVSERERDFGFWGCILLFFMFRDR